MSCMDQDQDDKLIDKMRLEFSKKNQAYGIWLVIQSAIVSVGDNVTVDTIGNK